MPELPEVETIVRGLNSMIKGLTVQQLPHVSPHLLKREPHLRQLTGDTFRSFERRGKYIIALLKSGRRLMIHLRMSGRILVGEDQRRRDKHDHLEIIFRARRRRLVFRDIRKFGVIQFIRNDQQETLDRLGTEAPTITASQLQSLVCRSKRPIKSLLLDQSVIAGLGNIYVDESLYRSGIHPLKASSSLSDNEVGALARAIRQIMALAIRNLGTTFDSYSGVNGESGRFTRYLKVYNQNGNRCCKCGNIIVKIKVGGRGTHFCPTCQKDSRRR
jgi:formamidopyrimidine-DNA glycosylase